MKDYAIEFGKIKDKWYVKKTTSHKTTTKWFKKKETALLELSRVTQEIDKIKVKKE